VRRTFWGEHEFAEEVDELVRVDEVVHVSLGALAEDLFVHANPILADSHVVGHNRITPPHMERERDDAGCSGCSSVIEILRHGDRSGRGSERKVRVLAILTSLRRRLRIPRANAKVGTVSGTQRDSIAAQSCTTLPVGALQQQRSAGTLREVPAQTGELTPFTM